jgi:TIR domain
MRSWVFLSFSTASDARLEEVASHAQELGLGVAGRFVPLGGALELIPDLRQQLRASDAVLVVFDREALDDSVTHELDWSYEEGKGLVGVRLDQAATIPTLLYDAGAEILDWTESEDRSRLGGAIRAAARGAQLMERAREQGSGSGAPCARPKPRGT